MDRLVEDYWGHFLSAGPHDEELFRPYVLALVYEIQQCSFRNDWDQAARFRGLFQAGLTFFDEEPLATPYDLGRLHIELIFSSFDLVNGLYETVHSNVDRVLKMLQTGDERRARCGVRFRPNSEVRVRMLGQLAEAKLLGPVELRDEVLTPIQILRSYQESTRRMLDHMNKHPRLDRKADDDMRALAAEEGVFVCAMLAKLNHRYVGEAVRFFNEMHGLHLAQKGGHFRRNQPIDIMSQYYWDFELQKIVIDGSFTAAELLLCDSMRRAPLHRQQLDPAKQATIAGWDREMIRLRSRLRDRFELL
jgi:hypothetical protein